MRGQLIRRYFVTGLLIWVPLAITAWVLSLIVGTLDKTLHVLPSAIHPKQTLGIDLPGAGVILTLLIIFITGVLAANFIGQRLVKWWELLLARIPVVNSIYNSVKQVSDTLFSSSGNAFRKALLVEYPRRGAWTIAFLTGKPGGEVAAHLSGEHLSVYVPTTPNPTSGYLLFVPEEKMIRLKMPVDDALKMVISGGIITPPDRSRALVAAEEKQSKES